MINFFFFLEKMDSNISDLYYLQLKEGCISLKCDNTYCKSCSKFIYSEEDDDSLREKAQELASHHKSKNHLCTNFPRTLYDFSIFEKVIEFNDFLSNFSRKVKIANQKKITKIISDKDCYPFLFSHDLNEIDFYSIHPPQSLIKEFIQAEKNHPKDLDFLKSNLYNSISYLITNSELKPQYNSLSYIRAIFISFLFYELLSKNEKLLIDLISHVMSLSESAHLLLSDMFSKSPLLINELNTIIQKVLKQYIDQLKSFKIDKTIWNISKFIHFILSAANDKSGNTIAYETFANEVITKAFKSGRELRRFISLHSSLLYTPSVISLIKKQRLIPEGSIMTSSTHLVIPKVNSTFTLEDFVSHKKAHPIPELNPRRNRRDRNDDDDDERNHSDDDDEEGSDDDDINPSAILEILNILENIVQDRLRDQYLNDEEEEEEESLVSKSSSYDVGQDEFKSLANSVNVRKRKSAQLDLEVRRDHLLDDTLVGLLRAEPHELFGRLKVTFKGEDAIDIGGVTREFFNLVTNMVFSPDYGMFELINNRFYWFRREECEMERYYTLLGAFIGIAINNKVILPIRFPDILYKKLLKANNYSFNLNDLAEIDSQVANSLRELIKSKERGDNIEDIGMMFDLSVEYYGTEQIIELVEGGSEKPVTNDNLEEYIQKYIDWKLTKSIEKQFNAFKEGYNLICNTPMMKIFSPQELNILVSGIEKFNWEEFKKAVILKGGYKKDSNTIVDLWHIFDNDLNEQQRINFLYFVTGTKTAPAGGLKNLHIVIEKTSDCKLLPVAHTCFNRIEIPNYSDRKLLKTNLLICLENCEGFGLK